MRSAARGGLAFAMLLALAPAAAARPIADAGSAVEAAKKYTRARCTAQSPCRYKAERDGKRWRVWVRPMKPAPGHVRRRADEGPALVLYFDRDGNLLRRLEVD